MSKVVNVSDKAHAVLKEVAAEGKESITESASTFILFANYMLQMPEWQRLCSTAKSRSESPAATLTAALDALERPRGVTPAPKVEMLAPDGNAYCKCDGQPHPGPWHSRGCPRHSETEVPW